MMKNLYRPEEGRMIAGVAAGLANFLKINMNIIRLVWLGLLLFGGLPVILLYIMLWIALPSENSARRQEVA